MILKSKNDSLNYFQNGTKELDGKYMEFYEEQLSKFWTKDNMDYSLDAVDYEVAPIKEKEVITNIFKTFTNSDVLVDEAYMILIANHINLNSVKLSLNINSAFETIHQTSYSALVDIVSNDRNFYKSFLQTPEISDKFRYFATMVPKQEDQYATRKEYVEAVLEYIFVTSACVEGTSLFGQFSLLLGFSRGGKYNAMADVNLLSIKDENIHIKVFSNLFKDIIAEEFDGQMDDALIERLEDHISTIVAAEEQFVEFLVKDMPNREYAANSKFTIKPETHMEYINYIRDFRLYQFLDYPYPNVVNPYSFIDDMLSNDGINDFFSRKESAYSMISKDKETWSDVRAKRKAELDSKVKA